MENTDYLKRDFSYLVKGREGLKKRGILHASTVLWLNQMREKNNKEEVKKK